MILRRLSLSNFRSYGKAVFEFSPGVTLIRGANGSGKTNIIEAIVAAATGKSFRADSDREMISWGAEVTHISADTDDVTVEVILTAGTVQGVRAPLKKYLVDGVARRQVDFAGRVKTVLFWPEDLELVTDSPSMRRRYLDRVLVQVDREYRRSLNSYERGLRQRNRLLDRIRDGEAGRHQLLFWDKLLIEAGGQITDTRSSYLSYVSRTAEKRLPYGIVYDKSVISEARIEEYKDAEVAAGATLVGPHRDDFQFQIKFPISNIQKNEDKVDLSKYGSRGEQRLGVLWLKLAELSYILERTKDRPVLLLDDIFSELDEGNRQMVFDIVKNQQTIIASATEETGQLLSESGISAGIIRTGN